MSGPITPPLTVETVDGATEGRPITTIKVSNGDLTISGRTATIDTSGSGGSGTVTSIATTGPIQGGTITTTGTISIDKADSTTNGYLSSTDWTTFNNKGSGTVTVTGTPADNELAVWKTASSIEGDSNLTWDGSLFTVSGAMKVDNIKIDGNVVTSEDTNGDISIFPNGTGSVKISDKWYLPNDVTSDNDYVLTAQTDGTTAWAAAGGSGIGGSIADTQIAYGDSSSEITGDANFIWEASNKKLKINTPGGNPGALRVASSANNQLGASIEATMTSTTGNIDALYVKGGLTTGAHAAGFGTGISFRLADTGYSGTQAARIYTERLAADADSDLKLIASGTGNISLGNFEFDADQTVGVGQDNYVLTYDHANTQISLEAAGGGGSGDVTGPGSSTDNAIARFDGTTGKILQNSGPTIDDSGNLTIGDGTGNTYFSNTGSHDLIIWTNGGTDSGKIRIRDGVNADLSIQPNGTGAVEISGAYKLPTAVTGANDYVLTAQTDGTTAWAAGGGGGAASTIDTTNDTTDASRYLTFVANSATTSGQDLYTSGIVYLNPATQQLTFNGAVNLLGKVNVGSGLGSGYVQTNSAHDLILRTNDGTNSGTITITDGANGNLSLTPNGTGKVEISSAYTLPTDAGTDTYVLTSDGAGASSWAAGGGGPNILFPNAAMTTNYDQWNITNSPPYYAGGTSTTSTFTSNYQFYCPFIAPKSGDVSKMGIVQGGTVPGSTEYLYGAIYDSDSDNMPDSLSGYATFDISVGGTNYQSSFSSTITLVEGTLYWFAWSRSDNTSANFEFWDRPQRFSMNNAPAGFGCLLTNEVSTSTPPASAPSPASLYTYNQTVLCVSVIIT